MSRAFSIKKLNRTFGNVMIDLLPRNKKLINRSIDIIMNELSINEEVARKIYKLSDNNLKIAILMGKKNVSAKDASKVLEKNKGSLDKSLNE